MEERTLTEQTILQWLTLENCTADALDDPFEGISGHIFPCGLTITPALATKNPVLGAAHAIRTMHVRHHQFGHKPLQTHWGFWLGGDAESRWVADCLDCDPVPELGLEYDRNEFEGALPAW